MLIIHVLFQGGHSGSPESSAKQSTVSHQFLLEVGQAHRDHFFTVSANA
jgi:hypothetical protein